MVGQLLGHLVGQASGLGLGGSGRLESGLEAGLEAVVAGGPEEDLRHPVHLDLQRRPRPHLLEGGRETVASGRAHFELSARSEEEEREDEKERVRKTGISKRVRSLAKLLDKTIVDSTDRLMKNHAYVTFF